MKALIFHGTHGTPQGNWFQWLQEHLMVQGWQVATPKLPTPEGQSYDNWKTALEEQVPGFADVDVVFGHSCGGSFVLRLLEDNLIQPQKSYLIATVITPTGHGLDELNSTFIDPGFNWEKIKTACDDFVIFQGSDDPYVSMEQAETLSKNLGTPIQLLEKAGHINADAGYTDFPEILDFIDE